MVLCQEAMCLGGEKSASMMRVVLCSHGGNQSRRFRGQQSLFSDRQLCGNGSEVAVGVVSAQMVVKQFYWVGPEESGIVGIAAKLRSG